jgi:DNA-binding GntR family transcriptional regulator
MDRLESLKELAYIRSLPKKPLGELIYEALRKSILRGEMPSGERLVEERLARSVGSSRTPVREALKRLEQENLIQRLSSGGYEVRRVDLQEVEEIFEIRGLLEGYAASRATLRIKPDVLRELEEILSRSETSLQKGDVEEVIRLNTEFHDILYRASESPRLFQIIQGLWDTFYRYRRVILQVKGMARRSLEDHKGMIDAMRRGDANGVERLVREHIRRGFSILKEQIQRGTVSF